MSGEEHAKGCRGWGSFPAEWGMPEGAPFNEARAAWIAGKVCENRDLRALRVLNRRDRELQNFLRLLEVDDLQRPR